MSTRWMLGLVVALSVLTLALPARGDLPEVLDRVPGDARALIVIPSVNELDDASAQLLVAMEQPEASTLKQVLRILGVAGAIDPKRPVAAFWAPGQDGAAPVLAMLVPTFDAKRAMESVKAVKAGGTPEVWSFEAGGRSWFARELGHSDLLVGIEPGSIRNYSPVTGQMEAHRRSMGPEGVKVGDGAHVLVVGEMDEFRPLIRQWMGRAEGLMGGGGGVAGMIALAPGGDALMKVGGAMSEAMVRDAERCVVGVRCDGTGAVIDLVTLFAPGSEMDRASRAGRGSDQPVMFDTLPAQPFLAAIGIDASHEGVRDLAAGALSGGEQHPRTALDTASSIDIAVYEPGGPIVVQGALTRVLMHWRAEAPGDLASWFRSYLKSLDGVGGASVSYDQGSGTYSGVGVDRWSMSMPANGGQRTQLMYGQHATPRGVVAVREKDGYLSAAPDDLISNVLAGRAAGVLSGNALVRDLTAKLPEHPVAVGFLNFRPVLVQVMPLLAMMGINIDVPSRIPPVAGAVSMQEGSARVGVFLPAYALKLGLQGWGVYSAANAPAPTPAPSTPARGR